MKLPELKRVRELRGMTMQELSKAAKVSTGTIVNLEVRDRPGLPGTARKLAEALGVSIAVLAGQEPYPSGVPQLSLPYMMRMPDSAARHRVLAGGTPEQASRYLRDLDRALLGAGQQLRHPDHQQPGEQEGLSNYMQALLELREEAEPYVSTAPGAQEMAHASVQTAGVA
jgi:transcriptional regulator with XRE-family HTH domain